MMPAGYYARNVFARLELFLARALFHACCWAGWSLMEMARKIGRRR